ncbi:DUF3750 domain-containing protein [Ahrensia kielensis]|uniref:DUF3750 domain-containing protein n=1 Tax=Ahrensia kielensis TaxID=76980 RepID=A0ABU9T880_9HYPH
MRFVFRYSFIFLLPFLLPTIGAAAWWTSVERPASWRSADWGSSGLLSKQRDKDQPTIYIMAARTGGFKGAFAVHSWIVIKREDQDGYDRYDKLGWGSPIRKNNYAADAYWYSNKPSIIAKITGEEAKRLIPKVENAISAYRYSNAGDYTIWPGPNSNTFVADVLRNVPELNASLPPNAVGKDYLGDDTWFMRTSNNSDTYINLGGYIGFAFGRTVGFELQFMGQTIGLDIQKPAIKLPAFGRLELSKDAAL